MVIHSILVIILCLLSQPLHSMERAKAAAAAKFTKPKPKNPPVLSSFALMVSESGIPGVSSLAESFTSDDHPTAVYTRAKKTKDKREQRELIKKTADSDPERPSAAVKEANRRLYIDAEQIAHQNWINVPRYKLLGELEEAAKCQRLYESEIKKAQGRYLGYQKADQYEKNNSVDREALKKEVKAYFLKLHYAWDIELAEFFWQEMSSVLFDKSKIEILPELFDNAIATPSQPVQIASPREDDSDDSEEDSVELDMAKLDLVALSESDTRRKRASFDGKRNSTISQSEIKQQASANSPTQVPTLVRRSSNADSRQRVSSPGRVQNKYDMLSEQFTKHVTSAKGYYREWQKCQHAELAIEKIDELVTTEFNTQKSKFLSLLKKPEPAK